ncbi:metalloregulator ArsR/SmtB family transcription factor [Nocardia jiangsuensis]|uniref:Metalloregulator ArsR/SmtB family transcription factor n=1 Tax=Nocardia jiangsuensis TaxID=1691563 RepID=A0ABV8E144_9NOCA
MEQIAAALGDPARWRLVELLAERPRSVGELAERTGLRQPQATKHLQTLARAGLVTVVPLGQRRVYALEPAVLGALTDRLRALVATAAVQAGERDVIARYRAAIEAEAAIADRSRWADGRAYAFERLLPAPRETVWRYWTEPELLAAWWAPPSLTVTEAVLEPVAGGRAVLEYRDAEGRYRSAGRVRRATPEELLEFELSVLDPAGGTTFTGHYDVTLEPAAAGTRLRVAVRVTGTTVEAVPAIAGIETGWGQVLDNLADAVGTRSKETPA